jgi:hypothetical protein
MQFSFFNPPEFPYLGKGFVTFILPAEEIRSPDIYIIETLSGKFSLD